MIIRSAIITVGSGRAALFLVDRDQLYPEPAAAFLRQVAHIHPHLGRVLVSPRIQGFSYTWAQFDFRGTVNTDEIAWVEHDICVQPKEELPF
jgi:hypothetical protein